MTATISPTPYNACVYLHGARPEVYPEDMARAVCVICGLTRPKPIRLVMDLGEQPLANALLSSPDEPFKRYPLQLGECPNCGHVQLAQTVRPDLMFDAYTYRTGISRTMREHFGALAVSLRRELGAGKRVCEVGCNDGTLLRALKAEGFSAYGIDPSSVAQSVDDVRIVPRYLTRRTAEELRAEYGPVDCVVMTNVLAHTPDPQDLILAAWELLDERGLLVIECPYVRDMVNGGAWDTVYHEHVSYFSVKDLARLCMGKFWKADVARIPVHGGSLRFTARKTPYTWLSFWGEDPYWQVLAREEMTPIDWDGFAAARDRCASDLRQAVAGARDVAGYGCPAKAAVLLNYTGIRPNRIVDDTPEKQGKWLPGVGCPIVPRDQLGDPDKVLLLPWNFTDEITAKEPALKGRWVVPMPTVRTL